MGLSTRIWNVLKEKLDNIISRLPLSGDNNLKVALAEDLIDLISNIKTIINYLNDIVEHIKYNIRRYYVYGYYNLGGIESGGTVYAGQSKVIFTKKTYTIQAGTEKILAEIRANGKVRVYIHFETTPQTLEIRVKQEETGYEDKITLSEDGYFDVLGVGRYSYISIYVKNTGTSDVDIKYAMVMLP